MTADHPLTRGLSLSIISPCATLLKLKAIPVRVVPEFNRPRLPQFWMQAQLPRHVDGGLLSFCNLAPVGIRRQIVCMDDIHAWLKPGRYGTLLRWLHRSMLRALADRVAHVTTVSAFARTRLIALGVVSEDRTTVTFGGSDHADRWDAERLLLGSGQRPYVVASDRSPENLQFLFRIAPMLDMIGVDLWLAGDLREDAAAGLRNKAAGNIRLLGHVGDNALKGVLAGALGFLLPSRSDGFGLSGIEAMASECPVIASSTPCLYEICEDAALYAERDDPGAWVRHVARLKCEPRFRGKWVEAGRRRAGELTWSRVAEVYLELMRRVDCAGQPA